MRYAELSDRPIPRQLLEPTLKEKQRQEQKMQLLATVEKEKASSLRLPQEEEVKASEEKEKKRIEQESAKRDEEGDILSHSRPQKGVAEATSPLVTKPNEEVPVQAREEQIGAPDKEEKQVVDVARQNVSSTSSTQPTRR